MEVGVYPGGSLGMWRRYFGPNSMIFGVDIEPACRSYANEGVEIIIGIKATEISGRKCGVISGRWTYSLTMARIFPPTRHSRSARCFRM